ncbi:MAG: DNA/RNA non-specific endonuclease [Thiotrichales bacterium]|nr:DNA/RNA non-specific endonuclease [Thiotrichales bacterium]
MTARQLLRLIQPVTKLIIHNPKYIFGAVLVAVLWFAYETQIARPGMSYMGIPKLVEQPATGNWSHILRNQGYMLEYSESLKNPLWVIYQVGDKQYDSGKRPSGFTKDWRSLASVSHDDYTGSGYDRGHMAPNYLIATRYGRSAQLETFLMTNITPQKPNLNQKSWQRLEEIVANDFSEWHGNFWVVTGPIFDDNPKTLKNSSVPIPKAFYKILMQPASADMPGKALAFVFPQNARANSNLMTFVTTIDDVEKQTGIDFFHKLDDEMEARLESSKTPEAWRLPEVANRPSRY